MEMKLKKLQLFNFRIDNLELDFSDKEKVARLSELEKEIIKEAIGFAIYGFRALKTSKPELMKGKKECWVRLEFEYEGETYDVYREIKENNDEYAKLKINGLPAAFSWQTVTAFLERKIGMDLETFQNNIDKELKNTAFFYYSQN